MNEIQTERLKIELAAREFLPKVQNHEFVYPLIKKLFHILKYHQKIPSDWSVETFCLEIYRNPDAFDMNTKGWW